MSNETKDETSSANPALAQLAEAAGSGTPDTGTIQVDPFPTATGDSDRELVEEVTTRTIRLPEVLNEPTTDEAPWELDIYSKVCFDCTGFNPNGEKRWERMPCRPSSGNVNCPVGQIQVKIVGKNKMIAERLKQARLSGDPQDLIEAVTALNSPNLDAAARAWILREAGLVASQEILSTPA